METERRAFLGSLIGTLGILPLRGQEKSNQPYVPKQSDRPEPASGDGPGFTLIFDGKTLDGWEGDPRYWRVEEGALIGEVTPETLLKSNTFIVWRGGSPKDFELKADYRISSGGNSGINYRSVVVPDKVTPENKFAMRGYQADIDGRNAYTGQNYEEKGRLFLALRGQTTHVLSGQKPIVLASLGDSKELASFIGNDWNSYHLIIRGNTLIHILNGHLMSVVIDDDAPNRTFEGLIGVQVHVGPPMKVEYRNFRLKER
jgi:3-keto-disaccharide hydrolase